MKVFFGGSFDPFTNGHLAVVKKAVVAFGEVIIGVKANADKIRHFDINEMTKAIKKVVESEKLANVTVICFTRPTAKVALEYNSGFIVKGLRNSSDYCYEEPRSKQHVQEGIDTIYFRTNTDVESISSTEVRRLFFQGEDISQYVPKEIMAVITRRY